MKKFFLTILLVVMLLSLRGISKRINPTLLPSPAPSYAACAMWQGA